MAQVAYAGTVQTPINADELDDLSIHLKVLADALGVDLSSIKLEFLAHGLVELSFGAEVTP
jgi:hypothetical protein